MGTAVACRHHEVEVRRQQTIAMAGCVGPWHARVVLKLDGARSSMAVGLLAFAVYVASPQKVHTDSLWSMPAALSLVFRGDLNLDEYRESCVSVGYACSEINGHLWSDFPVGPSIIAAAPLAVFEAVTGLTEPLWSHVTVLARAMARWRTHSRVVGAIDVHFFEVTENIVASLCVAVAAAFLHAALRRRFAGTRRMQAAAAGSTAIFVLGTPAWSTASRVLWQHGPALMFGAIALYLLVARRGVGAQLALGGALAAAWVCRPTMALFALCTFALLAWRRRDALLSVGAGFGVVAAAFVLFNLVSLGMPLPPYFAGSRLDLLASYAPEALAGHLFSPSRGLLCFSPVFLLIPWCLLGSFRARDEWFPIDVVISAWLVLHWLVISSFHHWWGGHAYGPRLWTETALGAVWLLSRGAMMSWSTTRRATFVTLVAASVVAHAHGALSYTPWTWNTSPVSVDDAPSRVWDWRDPQSLRGWL